MDKKPFKSIEEQVELLQSRGVKIDSTTAGILMREGYYSVVNGYKGPFIDEERTKEAGEDRYRPGTSFDDIYGVFAFDRDLRELTFHHLLRIEALLRTVSCYTFAERHPECSSYLDRGSFATQKEYRELGLSNYARNMTRLQATFNNALENPRNEAVEHYLHEYGEVPIWVLANTLSFGAIEHFFNLMSREDQNLICRRIVQMTDSPGHLAPISARRAIDVLVKFRNICAHDERLYCARVDKRNPVDYFGCVSYASKSKLDIIRRYRSNTFYLIKRIIRYYSNYRTIRNSTLQIRLFVHEFVHEKQKAPRLPHGAETGRIRQSDLRGVDLSRELVHYLQQHLGEVQEPHRILLRHEDYLVGRLVAALPDGVHPVPTARWNPAVVVEEVYVRDEGAVLGSALIHGYVHEQLPHAKNCGGIGRILDAAPHFSVERCH